MTKVYLKKVEVDKNNGCLQNFTHHRCYFSQHGQCQAKVKGLFKKYCNDEIEKFPYVYIQVFPEVKK